VSVFRPSARATAPDGRSWEIYAYRINVRDRAPYEPGSFADDRMVYDGRGVVVFGLLEAVWWLLSLVPRLLVHLFDIAVAAVRAIGSDEWTVEAVTWMPQRESYRWTTTREYRGQVLAQIEAGLSQGDIPRPRNAIYGGVDNRSAR
jgi:hypothetical protein